MSAQDVQNKEIFLFEYWNELPNELKLECIKKMTFMARTKLRLASKTEMGLVESIKEKYQFYYVHLNVEKVSFRNQFVAKSDGNGTEIVVKRADNAHRLDKFFATSKIELLRIKFKGGDPKVIECLDELIRSDVKIQAETVQGTFCSANDFAQKLIEKCDPAKLKKIVVLSFLPTHVELFKVPQVCAVQTIHFKRTYDHDNRTMSSEGWYLLRLIRDILKMWKKNDYPLGKEAIFEYGSCGFHFIRNGLPFVVIHQNDERFCIPVSNAKKCIWFFKPNQLKYTVVFTAEKPSANVPFPDFNAIMKRKIEEEKAERKKVVRRLKKDQGY